MVEEYQNIPSTWYKMYDVRVCRSLPLDCQDGKANSRHYQKQLESVKSMFLAC